MEKETYLRMYEAIAKVYLETSRDVQNPKRIWCENKLQELQDKIELENIK